MLAAPDDHVGAKLVATCIPLVHSRYVTLALQGARSLTTGQDRYAMQTIFYLDWPSLFGETRLDITEQTLWISAAQAKTFAIFANHT